jgi:hypothetical protein
MHCPKDHVLGKSGVVGYVPLRAIDGAGKELIGCEEGALNRRLLVLCGGPLDGSLEARIMRVEEFRPRVVSCQ